jgi:hypothetical protein
MIECLPMYLKLPETGFKQEELSLGLADGDDLPF